MKIIVPKTEDIGRQFPKRVFAPQVSRGREETHSFAEVFLKKLNHPDESLRSTTKPP